MIEAPPLQNLEARALWHLQLDPAQLFADCVEDPSSLGLVYCDIENDEGDFDYDEENDLACTHCGGEGYREVEDIWWDECDEFGYGPSTSCRGTGSRNHQWVF